MKLTRYQLKVLKIWLRYHAFGFTFTELLKTSWGQWLFLIAAAMYVYFWRMPTDSAFVNLFFGICIGILIRDFSYHQETRRIWPIFDKLIQWNIVSDSVKMSGK